MPHGLVTPIDMWCMHVIPCFYLVQTSLNYPTTGVRNAFVKYAWHVEDRPASLGVCDSLRKWLVAPRVHNRDAVRVQSVEEGLRHENAHMMPNNTSFTIKYTSMGNSRRTMNVTQAHVLQDPKRELRAGATKPAHRVVGTLFIRLTDPGPTPEMQDDKQALCFLYEEMFVNCLKAPKRYSTASPPKSRSTQTTSSYVGSATVICRNGV
ncbi:hypothetical protein EDB89DRAFT_1905748 [Lactarius sanguifluus]|nr:hypothetical protein EDB89DRAFT_1905748 [Lactarius sanguifluus]